MRDLILTLVVFGLIPIALMRPYIGLLAWSWIGYMNPHRLTYGFAYSFPFAAIFAGVTLVALFLSKEKKTFPVNAVTVLWILLVSWFCVTTLFALIPYNAEPQLSRTLKIQLMILATFLVINSRERLHALVLTIVVSIGFYGVKGGAFAIATGGSYRVWGPDGSFIAGNNEIALALVMILPLMRYLQLSSENKWVRRAYMASMVLTTAAIIASYSRGAFLAIIVMALFFWIKSKKKILLGVLLIALGVGGLSLMPRAWWDRMNTIETYQTDQSALGRINSWHFAINLAVDRPLVGGGFGAFNSRLFQIYAPNPDMFHDAHSIYFEILGEQGFVGLLLFLTMFSVAYFYGGQVVRLTAQKPELLWAHNMASMMQVGLLGYAAGGAFLGLGYFDLPYHFMAILVILKTLVDKQMNAPKQDNHNSLSMKSGNSQ